MSFEGGEAETLVLDCPLLKRGLKSRKWIRYGIRTVDM